MTILLVPKPYRVETHADRYTLFREGVFLARVRTTRAVFLAVRFFSLTPYRDAYRVSRRAVEHEEGFHEKDRSI